MGDTFAIVRTLEEHSPTSALIVGAGYVGLEMAETLNRRMSLVSRRRCSHFTWGVARVCATDYDRPILS